MSRFLIRACLETSLKYSQAVNGRVSVIKNSWHILPAAQRSYSTQKPIDGNSNEWRAVYHFPLIQAASAFNRLKISYGIMNCIVVPSVFALEHSAYLPPTTAVLISAVGTTLWCTLAITSFLTRNLIGIIYVNDNNDKLRLAYVDYWGKRHDVCVDLDDVIPENEKKRPSRVDFFQTICLYSNDKAKYKLLQRFGNIKDPNTFSRILGE